MFTCCSLFLLLFIPLHYASNFTCCSLFLLLFISLSNVSNVHMLFLHHLMSPMFICCSHLSLYHSSVHSPLSGLREFARVRQDVIGRCKAWAWRPLAPSFPHTTSFFLPLPVTPQPPFLLPLFLRILFAQLVLLHPTPNYQLEFHSFHISTEDNWR